MTLPNTVPALAHKAQAAAATLRAGKAPALKVTGRTRTAIQAMVFEGLNRSEAAEHAGMSDHSLREALKKPHVLAYLNDQMEVLRTGARPRAIHKIIKLADRAESERVQLDAARYLDGLDRNSSTIGGQQVNVQVNNTVNVETPGYVIRLERKADRPAHGADQIEHLVPHVAKPLASNEDVPDDA